MSKFILSQFEVKAAPVNPGAKPDNVAMAPDIRIMKSDASASIEPKPYVFEPLHKKSSEQGYTATKAKYGPLAATDPERSARTRKDKRFSLSPLLRDPLSVEEEERRAIEERVRARVAAVADEAKARAEQEGHQAGLKKGHDEAFAKFQKEGEERLARLELLLSEMESAKEKIFEANERFLIAMVYQIAKMVLLKDVAMDKEYILRTCRDLIEKSGVRENITIRISPEDSASLGMIKEGIEKALGSLKNLNVEASPQVKLGGCMIETQWNVIDASIETQLKGIKDSLLGSSAGSDKS